MTQPDGIIFDDDEPQETVTEEVDQEVEEVEEVEEEDDDDTEDQETDSDSSTDSDEDHEKSTFTKEQQRVFDAAISKKVAKLRETEREAESLKRRLSEYEQAAPRSRPQVPPLPDPFALSDQEYRQKLMQRDQAIIAAASYDTEQQMARREQQRLANEQQQKEQEALVEKVQTYSQRAKRLGVRADELQAAGAVVGQFGMDDQLVQFILDDDKGPLITKYLSQNLAELDKLRSMSTTAAAVRIATTIKANATALKPKVTTAPEPLSKPRPSGVQPKPKGPKGVTFE